MLRLLLGLWLISWVPAAWAAMSVTLLLSEPGGIYQEAAQALQAELEEAGVRVTQQTVAQREPEREDWVVALGVAALQHALDERNTTPVMALLVPRASYTRLTAGRTRPVTALYLDQPLWRTAALMRLALPGIRRVGAILGPATRQIREDMRQACAAQGLELHAVTIDSAAALFPALADLADEIDVLRLVPDPLVVNRNTLQSLLLQTYHLRRPVVAYSAALVEAGALLGLYATPAQLGREAGRWLQDLGYGSARKLPAPRYPNSLTVGINPSVAHSLGLTLPPAEVLARRVEEVSAP
jgi:ABC-type uncharacterized transport system substrate-binding protein